MAVITAEGYAFVSNNQQPFTRSSEEQWNPVAIVSDNQQPFSRSLDEQWNPIAVVLDVKPQPPAQIAPSWRRPVRVLSES